MATETAGAAPKQGKEEVLPGVYLDWGLFRGQMTDEEEAPVEPGTTETEEVEAVEETAPAERGEAEKLEEPKVETLQKLGEVAVRAVEGVTAEEDATEGGAEAAMTMVDRDDSMDERDPLSAGAMQEWLQECIEQWDRAQQEKLKELRWVLEQNQRSLKINTAALDANEPMDDSLRRDFIAAATACDENIHECKRLIRELELDRKDREGFSQSEWADLVAVSELRSTLRPWWEAATAGDAEFAGKYQAMTNREKAHGLKEYLVGQLDEAEQENDEAKMSEYQVRLDLARHLEFSHTPEALEELFKDGPQVAVA